MNRRWALLLCCGALLTAGLSGCAAPSEQPTPPTPAKAGIVDYRCQADSDCAVKNIGNCCGYYPACVNQHSATYPQQVRADCARDGKMAVCGFREIAACSCNEGRCEATANPLTGDSKGVQ